MFSNNQRRAITDSNNIIKGICFGIRKEIFFDVILDPVNHNHTFDYDWYIYMNDQKVSITGTDYDGYILYLYTEDANIKIEDLKSIRITWSLIRNIRLNPRNGRGLKKEVLEGLRDEKLCKEQILQATERWYFDNDDVARIDSEDESEIEFYDLLTATRTYINF